MRQIIQIRNLSALKDLDDDVGIDHLPDVWTGWPWQVNTFRDGAAFLALGLTAGHAQTSEMPRNKKLLKSGWQGPIISEYRDKKHGWRPNKTLTLLPESCITYQVPGT